MSLGFRDLDVYQEAFRLGVWAGSFARQLKNARDQRLGDQIIRSARSVPANIAEAWRKRMYPAHFAAKITDAEAEAAETQVWIDFAYSDGLIDSTLHASHRQAYEKILTQLTNLRRTHTSRQAVPRPHQPRAQKPRTTQSPADAPTSAESAKALTHPRRRQTLPHQPRAQKR